MNIKSWLQMLAHASHAQMQEMAELMAGMRGKDRRDPAEEAQLQDFIASYPDPHDGGNAEILKQARLAAGRCCECGNPPKEQTT